LRYTGLAAVGASATQLVVTLITAFPSSFRLDIVALVMTGVLLAGSVFVTVVVHENLRKTGDALFEEISDELQRRFKRRTVSDKPSVSGEPSPYLAARITLRSFSSTADLPLVPGKFGPGLYAFVSVVQLILEFLTVSFRQPRSPY
jgi:hypothetical protein